MNITIVGTGYVGLSNAMLLSQQHHIIALDVNESKVNLLKKKISPIQDELIQEFLLKAPHFIATNNKDIAYKEPELIIIATPTNYDESKNFFDTTSIESVLTELYSRKKTADIVIKSTVPVGFTQRMQEQFPFLNIIFSPEFLREGRALYDNLYPSRIIIGDKSHKGIKIGNLFKDSCLKKDVEILLLDSTEAEAVKLFSNTYLAMRVAYFNELDSYCATRGLNTKDIINAVSLDPRIGNQYNNPSFGYGGYCLPKDTKQLLANYQDIPQNLIAAIIQSNSTRKDFITNQILEKKPNTVGVYRLIMKQGSDNFRKSAIQGIMKRLQQNGINVIVYEPSITDDQFFEHKVINNLTDFKTKSDIILVNRMSEELSDVTAKIYTRDIFGEN